MCRYASGVEVQVDDQFEFNPTMTKFQPSEWDVPVKAGIDG